MRFATFLFGGVVGALTAALFSRQRSRQWLSVAWSGVGQSMADALGRAIARAIEAKVKTGAEEERPKETPDM
ncbi:MAG: hypothetical protein BLM47_08445 [Candidatus Reconcilbacillus cellulovorans]|uniref:Uncharacterized protein n=1 Tax=Candidatus Reconcilbacillus cellulovorans TaxID=1906605 RepID=A0A2A6DZ44_9BACL|nr:MAG: hypothetical protein BLM47_08445 [Candidatus Reconcilbacillus cellulovorans]